MGVSAEGRRHRRGRRRHRDGNPAGRRRIRLHDLRPRRRLRRHLAPQHVPGCGLRCPVASVLVFFRAQPAVEQDVCEPARDPRLPREGGRRPRARRTPAAQHRGHHGAVVGQRAMLDAVHRRRAGARLRRGGERGRNARCAPHSRHPWGTAVSGPAIPFVALGSQSVNGGGAGGVHRYGRQRDPIRSRDRPKNRAAHGVSADPDLDRAPVRLPVHPRAARAIRTRPERGAKAARRGLRRLRVIQLRRRRPTDARRDRTGPQLPDAQGGRPRAAGKADAGLSGRLQAAADVA